MKDKLEEFLEGLPDFAQQKHRHRWLAPRFGFFLTEVLKEPSIVVSRVRDCYEAASLRAPGNISDVLSKSGAVVKMRTGLQLNRDAKTEIRRALSNTLSDPETEYVKPHAVDLSGKAQNVVVIYGRDERLRKDFFNFLRALKLNPIEWEEAIKVTGHGVPYVGDVLKAVFDLGQAVVVLVTPDERVELREDLRHSEEDWEPQLNQPRPNVLFEAGMALARDEEHTIIVQIGQVRRVSDLEGRHFVRLNDAPEKRHALASRLLTAGCAVVTTGSDWLNVGNLEVKDKRTKTGRKGRIR